MFTCRPSSDYALSSCSSYVLLGCKDKECRPVTTQNCRRGKKVQSTGRKQVEEAWQRGNKMQAERVWGADFTLAGPGAVVWDEPSPTGVRLGRAHLTRVTPGPSHCGTAQRLCANDACQLPLAHLVNHRGEARPSSVVCQDKAYNHVFLWMLTSICVNL